MAQQNSPAVRVALMVNEHDTIACNAQTRERERERERERAGSGLLDSRVLNLSLSFICASFVIHLFCVRNATWKRNSHPCLRRPRQLLTLELERQQLQLDLLKSGEADRRTSRSLSRGRKKRSSSRTAQLSTQHTSTARARVFVQIGLRALTPMRLNLHALCCPGVC